MPPIEWAFLTLSTLLITTIVAAVVAWVVAGHRFGTLAFRVAEMEAAVEHYWDRIRKRVRVEPYEKPSLQSLRETNLNREMTSDEIREYVLSRNPHLRGANEWKGG